jgi:hypothetical protein
MRKIRFNIELISERLVKTTEWLAQQEEAKGLALGYFGASIGAAAALKAADLLLPPSPRGTSDSGGRNGGRSSGMLVGCEGCKP